MTNREVTVLSSSVIEEQDNLLAVGVEVLMYFSKERGGPVTHACIGWCDDIFNEDTYHKHIVPLKRILYEAATSV